VLTFKELDTLDILIEIVTRLIVILVQGILTQLGMRGECRMILGRSCSLVTKADFSLDRTINYEPNGQWNLRDLQFYVKSEPKFSQLITNWSSYEDDLVAELQY
jgi:hypothetical protein